MEFYWFERGRQSDTSLSQRISKLKNAKFDGVMYPFSPPMGDFFTRISRIFDPETKFKYIVSIRPYAISAQYLNMICESMNSIAKDKIGINFLTGYVNDYEKTFGGILSDINDYSSNVERSNYMLEYSKEFKKIGKAPFFVSTTNEAVFKTCTKNELPMILPLMRYRSEWAKLNDQKVMLAVAPVFESPELIDWQCDNNNQCRHPKGEPCMDLDFFTKKTFFEFLDKCKADGIYGIIFQESEYEVEQYDKILLYVNEYKEL